MGFSLESSACTASSVVRVSLAMTAFRTKWELHLMIWLRMWLSLA